MKKAIIVCVDKNIDDANRSLDELSNLLETLNITTIERVIQKSDKFNNKTYIGR